MDSEIVELQKSPEVVSDSTAVSSVHTPHFDSIRVNPILERATQTRETVFSEGAWRVVECLETGFVYLENPPEYAELAQNYAWEKTYQIEKKRREEQEPMRTRLSAFVKKCRAVTKRRDKAANEAVTLLAQNRRHDRRMRVGDIGCGEGRYGASIAQKAMYQYGLDVEPIGIEISDYLAGVAHKRMAKYGGRVIHKPAVDGLAELEDNSIDIIVLLSFLEHEVNPASLLRLCAEKLDQTGRIVLKVPNFNSINRVRRGKQWCGFRYPDHVNYFAPETLKLLLSHTGLTASRMNFIDTWPTNDNMWAIIRKV